MHASLLRKTLGLTWSSYGQNRLTIMGTHSTQHVALKHTHTHTQTHREKERKRERKTTHA